MAKTEISVPEKVYNLCVELAEARREKKTAIKTYTENIKRIEAEINDLLDEVEGAVTEAQREA